MAKQPKGERTRFRVLFDYRAKGGKYRSRCIADHLEGECDLSDVQMLGMAAASLVASTCQMSNLGFEKAMEEINAAAIRIAGDESRRRK